MPRRFIYKFLLQIIRNIVMLVCEIAVDARGNLVGVDYSMPHQLKFITGKYFQRHHCLLLE